MNSRRVSSYISPLFSVLLPLNVWASTIDFGSADAYAVLGEAGVTNTGPSMIFGNVGGSIGTPCNHRLSSRHSGRAVGTIDRKCHGLQRRQLGVHPRSRFGGCH